MKKKTSGLRELMERNLIIIRYNMEYIDDDDLSSIEPELKALLDFSESLAKFPKWLEDYKLTVEMR